MRKKKVELLAPAGNPEGLYGALHAGADGVYLGGNSFSARAYADNFTEDELIEGIQYAHINNRKVYLTVNTLIKEREFEKLHKDLLPLCEEGLDGVIIQDIGVFAYIKRCFVNRGFPDLKLHVSTQTTLTGKYGAGMLREMGASRIVPARELSLKEIKEIKAETGLEIETFIHGAMCYSYSGLCLFSSILGGRSGNRGRCAQPCRLPYQVKVQDILSDTCYPLSLKDMCMIQHIPELISSGIDAFKIEGRMKKPEYAAGVTAIYRKYLDQYDETPDKPIVVDEDDIRMLSSLYIRTDSQTGYYFRKNGSQMATLHSPSYDKTPDSLIEKIRSQYLLQKIRKKIDIYGEFRIGEPAQVTFVCGEYSATVTGKSVEKAATAPLTKEVVKRQLGKLGETFWIAEHIMVHLDAKSFYSLQELNELRRRAAKALMDEHNREFILHGMKEEHPAVIYGITEEHPAVIYGITEEHSAAKYGMAAVFRTQEQLSAFKDFQSTCQDMISWYRIYLDGDMFLRDHEQHYPRNASTFLEGIPVFLALPHIIRKEDEQYLKEMREILSLPHIIGCMVRSLEGYAYLKDSDYQGLISADAGIPLWNRESIHFWQDKLSSASLPPELTRQEQLELLSGIPTDRFLFEKMIYGRIPLMITANCVAKTTVGCRKSSDIAYLIDRYHKEFPVVLNCNHCMNIVFNSLPLSLHKEFEKWRGKAGLRLDFTVENRQETLEILEYYTSLWQWKDDKTFPFKEYTTGYEKRGVE